MPELVKGVTLQKAGEAIEEVSLRNGVRLHLLASWDGTEIVRQEIPKGKRFGLHPQEGWQALESFYVLEGEAEWEGGTGNLRIGPGDSLLGTPVGEPCLLRAQSDMVVLYVSSQPAFHLVSSQGSTLQDLAISVEQKDGYTVDHCRRIRDRSLEVAKRMGLSPVQQYNLFYGAFLHDLGKVGVPDEVLLKPGSLTAEEWLLMKQHTIIGGTMLRNTAFASGAYILEQHHERLDGSGYPRGLKGDQIAVESQIVAVVDSYDAMTTDRVYRPAMIPARALSELVNGIDRLYRRDVVEAFFQIIDS